MKKVFVLAGSDTSGGAGIQADLKTYQELGVYGMTALTTIVAQNPTNSWAHDVYPMEINTVKAQVSTILDGVGVDIMKTGMLPTTEIIQLAADTIEKYKLDAVVDPVLACKGQDEPLYPENAKALRELLVPKALITTPNLFEAGQLAEMDNITTVDEMKEAAKRIYDLGAKNVIVKGGSEVEGNKAIDVFYNGGDMVTVENDVIDTPYNHGAGCTFASAVTASVVKGQSPEEAVRFAKQFITNAIEQSWKLNEYVGPVNQFANRDATTLQR
ncbi:bifunctional hydroxymethylpyrimidine kinase/phosphomethylpyrimidine kinase [Alkalibacillus haloalkaliphilus]|uniref:bifunctional hydroxymethylpyrimidine kinase/phosphomethylpyrimidine kinase n=1 Tax=Alkalibacillus haloalkaliphilus TaxID=94136 RepID=UPI002936623A|nr:bifunctional hydroxymethylpyrimidine kinase/phosphomethylpyrimidine kinase [Alkalibacillus haloalkaliphilus]MDV2581323.1 bifunctional hydroxymethylpyrimidine kinase/phosphomethylpyrimidine kinase [Alkalibacillus haloalkaliphilus]